MAKYKCECGGEKDASGVKIKFVDGKVRHEIACECGKYMELANPKTGAPSFRSNRYGQVL
jgi:hypothetical protein